MEETKNCKSDPDAPEEMACASSSLSCSFCSTLNRSLYCCPRCKAAYCSTKCYRNEKHVGCSEQFYQECVKGELKGKKAGEGAGDGVETFEEHMERFLRGDVENMPGAPSDADDQGELIDSDDEVAGANEQPDEDAYLEKVLEETVKGYEEDEGDIERQLTCMRLGTDVEALMAALSEDERKAFAQLAERIHNDNQGLGESCFKRS